MREIIYIQAGEFANYTGTHFWNTQESYFTSGDVGEEDIETGVSFCESVDGQERTTLYPRLLAFDRKSNFGTLAAEKALDSLQDETSDGQRVWTNGQVEYRQEPVSKSVYQKRMDEEERGLERFDQSNTNNATEDVRYWSDFSRVYYLPRSLQKLPDLPDWEDSSLNWNQGGELFKRFDEETELMDGAVRLLVEDCDNPQGVQIMSDTSTFGGFMASFLASFRDEYFKLSSFALPVMSGAISRSSIDYDATTTKHLINEALYLCTLNEQSTMNVPIQDPNAWSGSKWNESLPYPSSSIYHQSAVLSTHIESCTLPFRLKNNRQSMASVCGLLNWRNTCPFGELRGVFPVDSTSSLDRIVYFSSNGSFQASRPYAQLNVTRGFSASQLQAYANWSEAQRSSRIASIASIHTVGYPMPSSFPAISQDPTRRNNFMGAPPTTAVLSSISSSPDIAKSFESYAALVESCVARRSPLLAVIDVSLDDLKDLANDLRTMQDKALEDDPDQA